MKSTLRRYRRPIIVVFHLAVTVLSSYCAFLLRFDFVFPDRLWAPWVQTLPLLLLVRGVTYGLLRLYEGLWRYASVWDLQKIVLAVVVSSLGFDLVVRGFLAVRPYPRSVLVIDAVLLIVLLGGARFVRRACREFSRIQSEKRILILGAGDAGEMIVRDMKNNNFYNATPIGFVDDEPSKVGQSIHGVKVLGTRADLPRIMEEERPHEVLVAVPSAQPFEVREIVHSLEPFKIPIKTLPNLSDLFDGRITVNQIRNLMVEDLMRRPAVDLDAEPVRQLVEGRRILITGAGGSIGSELAAQVARFGPSRLLLFERYENALHDVCFSLDTNHPGCGYEMLVGDVTDEVRVHEVFDVHRPEVVFHAAAHKHVPLMELSPSEAVKNNVRGTRLVAEAAARYGAGQFVLISTDKAVNPSSVMGASKRICELLVRAMPSNGTRFVAVRFGNVLDSNGSVTRRFAAQIAVGGPVTVTHPDIERYFMLIPEAVQLVLHAAAMDDCESIYALEMGKPIRIQDLARNLIRLLGFLPDVEIPVTFVGLRPGEKLTEELVEADEATEPSDVEQILRVRAQPVSAGRLRQQVAHLERAAAEGLHDDVLRLLVDIVPTFRPSYEATSSGLRSVDAAVD